MQQAEPIAPLLVRLAREFGKLAGLEAALAGAEIKKKATALIIGIVLLVVAALLGIAILATLTATLILAFALIVAPWLAALIVTGIYALVALILALIAKSQLSRALPPVPTKTIASIKENLAWASRLIK
jgi:hypothetical protein